MISSRLLVPVKKKNTFFLCRWIRGEWRHRRPRWRRPLRPSFSLWLLLLYRRFWFSLLSLYVFINSLLLSLSLYSLRAAVIIIILNIAILFSRKKNGKWCRVCKPSQGSLIGSCREQDLHHVWFFLCLLQFTFITRFVCLVEKGKRNPEFWNEKKKERRQQLQKIHKTTKVYFPSF